jgi:hypothetical protein
MIEVIRTLYKALEQCEEELNEFNEGNEQTHGQLEAREAMTYTDRMVKAKDLWQ